MNNFQAEKTIYLKMLGEMKVGTEYIVNPKNFIQIQAHRLKVRNTMKKMSSIGESDIAAQAIRISSKNGHLHNPGRHHPGRTFSSNQKLII